jgi:histone acetyltransferase (RNA polymerase elongator complex component)
MKKANVAIFVPHLGCPHACSFCNQREIAGQEAIPTPHDVAATAEAALELLGENAKDSEIAFFGGSFTAVDPALMISLLEAAHPFIGGKGFKGIRLSTRPDAIDANILMTLKKYGVTAIELGAQSMNPRVLALNRRGHTPHDVETACALIHAYGFELGLQMMTGLYGASVNDDIETAHKLATLLPQTVRIYPTIVIENTQLASLYRDGEYTPPSIDETVELCAELLEFFYEKQIAVIRLGLHAMPSLEQNYVAGPWHPAFCELCESVIYRKKAENALENLTVSGEIPRRVTFFVNPREISKLAGQHRKNLTELEGQFHTEIKIRGRELPVYTVEAQGGDVNKRCDFNS